MIQDLGKVESLILYLTGELQKEYIYVPRHKLTMEILKHYIEHDQQLQKNHNAHKAVMSRAITSLIEKGLLCGYYQAWHCFYGMERPDRFVGPGELGKKKNTKKSGEYYQPRLQYLKLTEAGEEYFNKLTS